MEIAHQSLSLAVKDIKSAVEFYMGIGYKALDGHGSVGEKWIMMDNGKMKIGLFQDMFESNIISFNPIDARRLYKIFEENGIEITMKSKSMENTDGPCSFMVKDPDGNLLLFDQFE